MFCLDTLEQLLPVSKVALTGLVDGQSS